MKLTFLGTSHGLAEPGRKFSSILLEISNNKYLIDCGCNPTEAFADMGIDPAELKAVFITHTHADHTYGLLAMINLMSWAYTYEKCDPDIFLPEINAAKIFTEFTKVNHETVRENIKFKQVSEGIVFGDGLIKVKAIKTHHIEPSYGYVVEAEGKMLLFTGDIASPPTETALFSGLNETDLIVGECAHFNGTDYAEVLRKINPKRFIFTHYSPYRLETATTLKEMLKDEIPVDFATDGMSIEL